MNMQHRADWATRVLGTLGGGKASSVTSARTVIWKESRNRLTVVSLLGTFESQALIRKH